MKKIQATLNPVHLDELTSKLFEIGVQGMTVTEARSLVCTVGKTDKLRRRDQKTDYGTKVLAEVVVRSELTARVVNTLEKFASPDQSKTDEIFVSDVLFAVRIRTGETGTEAI